MVLTFFCFKSIPISQQLFYKILQKEVWKMDQENETIEGETVISPTVAVRDRFSEHPSNLATLMREIRYRDMLEKLWPLLEDILPLAKKR